MSESAPRIEQPEQSDILGAAVGPSGVRRPDVSELAEALSLSPENIVDRGDGSLTFDALVIARDALQLQAEDLARRLEMYERAIRTWGEPSPVESPEPKPVAQQLEIPVDRRRSERPPKLVSETRPVINDEPSMIVSMEAFSPSEAPRVPSSDMPLSPRPRRREMMAKTQKLSTIQPPLRSGLAWMVAAGVVLGGLAMWTGHSLSRASSVKARAAVPENSAVVIQAAQAEMVSRPIVRPLGTPAPVSLVHLPHISISHFDVVWGDASVRQLRAALKRSIVRMKSCFEEEPGDALAFPDKLELSLRLREDGSIIWVKGVKDGGSESAQSCITRALHRTDYPESRSGLLLTTELAFKPR